MRRLKRLAIAPRLLYTLPRMAILPVRLISWVVLLSLVGLIGGAHTLLLSTFDITTGDASPIGKYSAHHSALVGFARIGTGEKARKALPSSQPVLRVSASVSVPAPLLIERAETAVPRSLAVPVYQRISVYRI